MTSIVWLMVYSNTTVYGDVIKVSTVHLTKDWSLAYFLTTHFFLKVLRW